MQTRRQRVRVRLSWSPQWEGHIRGWAINFIKKNQWRCDRLHDFDDLLQDAYLIFLKLQERYPRVIHAPHFMALYKRSLQNQFHDMARLRRKLRNAFVDTPAETALEYYTDQPDNYLDVIIAEAPEAARLAIKLISSNPGLLREEPASLRENLNMKLRRILGVGEEFDFATSIRNLLT